MLNSNKKSCLCDFFFLAIMRFRNRAIKIKLIERAVMKQLPGIQNI
jgi:hypothetical protein